ncbi:Nuclear speckle splicing regulatory protein 1 [Clonorchis sinensis]|uniref:Nuclear speckle splicing regulatory protein 1 n=1 Tax=Clonorchis sinensis TaxID=79923 RepID=A0A419QET3_CLOSI|nr:Nuclear speckle splicing regulatory protein 1 [Clonorchis sinensis]
MNATDIDCAYAFQMIGKPEQKVYGLSFPTRTAKEKPKTLVESVFAAESDEEPDTAQLKPLKIQSNTQSSHAKLHRKTKSDYEKAIEEDPSVFQYDEIYEDIRSEKDRQVNDILGGSKKESKYVGRLLKTAEERKLERELCLERKAQKEIEADAEQYGDKEAFVTSAYKEKLKQLQELVSKREEEQAREDYMDITKQQGLGGFYRYMYQHGMKPEETATASTSSASRVDDEVSTASDTTESPLTVLLDSRNRARRPKWLERELTDRKVRGSNPTSASRLPLSRLGQPGSIPALLGTERVLQLNDFFLLALFAIPGSGIVLWLKRKLTNRKVHGSNPTSASRLPLSRLGQPGSIPGLMLPSGGMTARRRKGVTAERLPSLLLFTIPLARTVVRIASVTLSVERPLPWIIYGSEQSHVVVLIVGVSTNQSSLAMSQSTAFARFENLFTERVKLEQNDETEQHRTSGEKHRRSKQDNAASESSNRSSRCSPKRRSSRDERPGMSSRDSRHSSRRSPTPRHETSRQREGTERDRTRSPKKPHSSGRHVDSNRPLDKSQRITTPETSRFPTESKNSRPADSKGGSQQVQRQTSDPNYIYARPRVTTDAQLEEARQRYLARKAAGIHPVIVDSDRSGVHLRCFPMRCNTQSTKDSSGSCLTAVPPEGSTGAEILPGCPSLDRGSREAEVRFEPRTLQSVNLRSNHLSHLAPFRIVCNI